MNKKKQLPITIGITFKPYVPAHVEYFKNKYNLVKLKNGQWDLVRYYETSTGKYVFISNDMETTWSVDDIEWWAFLPKLDNN